ncbi:hypothetical protein NEOKW01_0075 [Nematocida sp. AWRm80]|nr:hypothetical protein NEOKW01_0075 [Nematocida sp. AWRm80]
MHTEAEQKKERKRMQALLELFTSECKYTYDLILWTRTFKHLTVNSPNLGLTEKHLFLTNIMANTDEILVIHTELLSLMMGILKTTRSTSKNEFLALEVPEESVISICEGFSKRKPRLSKAYIEYATRIPKATGDMEHILGKNPIYASEIAEVLERVNRLHLGCMHFIMRPMQKITRYPLLLNAIQKNARPKEKESIEKAINNIQVINMQVNQNVQYSAAYFSLYHLAHSLNLSRDQHVSIGIMQKERKLLRLEENLDLFIDRTHKKNISLAILDNCVFFIENTIRRVNNKVAKEEKNIIDTFIPLNVLKVSKQYAEEQGMYIVDLTIPGKTYSIHGPEWVTDGIYQSVIEAKRFEQERFYKVTIIATRLGIQDKNISLVLLNNKEPSEENKPTIKTERNQQTEQKERPDSVYTSSTPDNHNAYNNQRTENDKNISKTEEEKEEETEKETKTEEEKKNKDDLQSKSVENTPTETSLSEENSPKKLVYLEQNTRAPIESSKVPSESISNETNTNLSNSSSSSDNNTETYTELEIKDSSIQLDHTFQAPEQTPEPQPTTELPKDITKQDTMIILPSSQLGRFGDLAIGTNKHMEILFGTERIQIDTKEAKNLVYSPSLQTVFFLRDLSLYYLVITSKSNLKESQAQPKKIAKKISVSFLKENIDTVEPEYKDCLVIKQIGYLGSEELIIYKLISTGDNTIKKSIFRKMYIAGNIMDIVFFGSHMVIASNDFELIDLQDLTTQELLDPLDKTIGLYVDKQMSKPISMKKIKDNRYLIVFDDLGLIVNRYGSRRKLNILFLWFMRIHSIHIIEDYVIALGTDLVKIYTLEDSILRSVIEIKEGKLLPHPTELLIYNDEFLYNIIINRNTTGKESKNQIEPNTIPNV